MKIKEDGDFRGDVEEKKIESKNVEKIKEKIIELEKGKGKKRLKDIIGRKKWELDKSWVLRKILGKGNEKVEEKKKRGLRWNFNVEKIMEVEREDKEEKNGERGKIEIRKDEEKKFGEIENIIVMDIKEEEIWRMWRNVISKMEEKIEIDKRNRKNESEEEEKWKKKGGSKREGEMNVEERKKKWGREKKRREEGKKENKIGEKKK